MLQSLEGLMPFPWSQIDSNKRIIVESERNFFKIELKTIAWFRLALSLVLLNVLPFTFFVLILRSLEGVSFSLQILYFNQVLGLIYVVCGSFSVFGFYRLYHVFISWNRTRWIFADRWKVIGERRIEGPIWQFAAALFFYISFPSAPAIYYNFVLYPNIYIFGAVSIEISVIVVWYLLLRRSRPARFR